jgi:rhamnose transport system permease protein
MSLLPGGKRHFRWWHEAVLVVLAAGLMGWASWIEPGFVSLDTQLALSTHVWELALMTVPMTFIIITAGIDLSIASTLALSAVTLGLCFQAGMPIALAAAAAVAVGAACGAINGIFVSAVRVHPLIVTLATMAAYSGAAEGISLARPVSGFPADFLTIGQGSLAGLPPAGWLFVVLALVAAVVLARTPFGRRLYAIGHNESAARFSGIAVGRIKLLLYTLSGLMAGVTAVILVAHRNTAKADLGSGMELDVITAVVLGGTSIFGGRGNIVGTVLGVLLIHETRELLSWRWNQDELTLVVIGGLLIASVLLNRLCQSRRKAGW